MSKPLTGSVHHITLPQGSGPPGKTKFSDFLTWMTEHASLLLRGCNNYSLTLFDIVWFMLT